MTCASHLNFSVSLASQMPPVTQMADFHFDSKVSFLATVEQAVTELEAAKTNINLEIRNQLIKEVIDRFPPVLPENFYLLSAIGFKTQLFYGYLEEITQNFANSSLPDEVFQKITKNYAKSDSPIFFSDFLQMKILAARGNPLIGRMIERDLENDPEDIRTFLPIYCDYWHKSEHHEAIRQMTTLLENYPQLKMNSLFKRDHLQRILTCYLEICRTKDKKIISLLRKLFENGLLELGEKKLIERIIQDLLNKKTKPF